MSNYITHIILVKVIANAKPKRALEMKEVGGQPVGGRIVNETERREGTACRTL
mgnify:CR=1 FL=1